MESSITYITNLLIQINYLQYFADYIVRRYSVKVAVHKNFTTFTGIHLCRSLFFNKLSGLGPVFLRNFKEKLKKYFVEKLGTIACYSPTNLLLPD